MKKIFKFFLVLFILILVISFTAPLLIKKYFNQNAEGIIGRKAHIQSLFFNPMNCSLSADELMIFEAKDSATFAGFRSFYVNVHFAKLLVGKFQLEEITLDSPFVNVINDAGLFNFHDLLPIKDTINVEEVHTSKEFEFEILNLNMKKGKIVYYEQDIDHRIIMDDLSFKLPRFAYNSRSANMDIQFVIDESGVLSMNNNFYPEESKFISHIKLSNLNIDLAEPYSKNYIKVRDINGRVNCDLNIQGDFKDTTKISLSGLAWVNNLEVRDSSVLPLFSADSIGIGIENISVFENQYSLNEILLRNISLRFDQLDSTNNLSNVFSPLLHSDTANVETVDTLKNKSILSYRIDTFLISGGTIIYRDYTLDNYFEYTISSINALADNISSLGMKAKISGLGILNQQGRFEANLLFDPNQPLDFDVNFSVKGFQMEDLSPFTLTYAGHPIFEGELIYTGKTLVRNGLMDSENKMTIYNLQVGEKASKNVLYSMPLKFAVFLLKDKDGVVNLDLPMNGNMNDPNFKFGPLIWQIIKQNLQKIVAAPGKLLASQFGMKEEEIQYLPFEALDTMLTEQSINTIFKLQELLDNKPGLVIELAYYSPMDTDIKNLALQKAKTFYIQEKFNPKTIEQREKRINSTSDRDIHFITFLRQEVENQSIPDDSLAIEWAGMENLLTEYTDLQIKRKEAIQNQLRQTDSLYLQQFRFIEQLEPPKFNVDQSGFVVDFDME